ncbi:MAG: NAD(P)H-quinone oxidoreductase [Flavisolibacter sp.]
MVKAAGVNRPDVTQRKGFYPAPKGAPADIPGLEVSGVVERCGSGVTKWRKGDPVCALVAGGGYAQYVVAHENLCLSCPEGWSLLEAAALPEGLFTVWHNLFERGKLQAGENFLVHGGSSGIGAAAIQLAKASGAQVFVTAGSSPKCQFCKDLGADLCLNYKNQDFELILKEQGVDVIMDMVGGDYINKNLNILNIDGRLIFINTIKGNHADVNFMEIIRKRIMITGSTLRSRDLGFKSKLTEAVKKNIWPLIASGKFRPFITRQYPLKDAAEAHARMESGEHMGKIILVNEM